MRENWWIPAVPKDSRPLWMQSDCYAKYEKQLAKRREAYWNEDTEVMYLIYGLQSNHGPVDVSNGKATFRIEDTHFADEWVWEEWEAQDSPDGKFVSFILNSARRKS